MRKISQSDCRQVGEYLFYDDDDCPTKSEYFLYEPLDIIFELETEYHLGGRKVLNQKWEQLLNKDETPMNFKEFKSRYKECLLWRYR